MSSQSVHDPSSTDPGRAAQALSEADRAEVDGRLVDAIAAAQVANRYQRDPDLELRLQVLRDAAWTELDLVPGRSSWPPAYPDLFPQVSGRLPEVGLDELTTETLGSGITRHGALLVRGMLGPEVVDRLVADIDTALDAFDQWEQHKAPTEDTSPWFALLKPASGYPLDKMPRGYVRGSGGVLVGDSPRMLFELTELFDRLGLIDMIGEYLGERPAISVKKWTLRRVPVDCGNCWHQDGAFMGDDIRTVNCWIALTDCGGDDADAPGLDVLPRRFDDLVEMGTYDAPFSTFVGRTVVDRVAGESGIEVTRPQVKAGDALLFDDLFLHATGTSPGMTRERYAIESWFFAPSTFPVDQVPLVL
jgi:hypothetical protein